MTKNKKILFAIFSLVFLFSASFVLANGDTGQRDVPIRLSNFLSFTVVSGLPEYISRIYNIMIGLAGGLASFMMIVAGFQWVLAHGDKGKIDKAVKRIENSIVGLFLVFGAYLILNTINPALLSLKLPEIKRIERKEMKFSRPSYVVHECSDYPTQEACEARPPDERCSWLPVGGPGSSGGRCTQRDVNLGTDSHGCILGRTGTGCNENGCCTDGSLCIVVNAMIVGPDSTRCSRGGVGSPCSRNEDCAGIDPPEARLCHVNRCLGNTNRPGAAPCSEDSQCTNGTCIREICRESNGRLGDVCVHTDREEACNEGLFCCYEVVGESNCRFYVRRDLDGNVCAAGAGGENRCMNKLPATIDTDPIEDRCLHQCTDDYQCLSNDCGATDIYGRNIQICGCTEEGGAAPCRAPRPYCITNYGVGQTNACANGTGGEPCDDDDDCNEGLQCDGYNRFLSTTGRCR